MRNKLLCYDEPKNDCANLPQTHCIKKIIVYFTAPLKGWRGVGIIKKTIYTELTLAGLLPSGGALKTMAAERLLFLKQVRWRKRHDKDSPMGLKGRLAPWGYLI
jgi:hypothetical protein